jgi:arylsulfatase A-like enzyme
VWNGHIQPGSSTNQKLATMDLYPTLLEVAGVSIDHDIDGISFLPILLGKQLDIADRTLYFTRREGGTRYGGLTIQAIQQSNWKLLQNSPFEAQELYNLEEDPYENINLIESAPEKYKHLNALMMKQLQQGGKIPWQSP